MPRISDVVQDSVIYLYPSADAARNGEHAGGTGLLVGWVESGVETPLEHVYAVTCAHVIEDGGPVIRLNTKDGDWDVIELDKADWYQEPNDVDLAVCPRPAERVVAFYNQRGTAEQWIKEGKTAIKWTRLSCRRFRHNAVRLQLHALAYNLANFMRTLALPKEVEHWSLTTIREKLVKIGARVVAHGRYVTFQMAEVAVPRDLFREILNLIDGLRRPSLAAG
jgi:hypothetical protein